MPDRFVSGDVGSPVIYAPLAGAAFVASIISELGLSNIVALAIVALGGLLTVRLNIGKTWQANYEAEREARKIAEEHLLQVTERAVKAETDLKIAESKTDLSVVVTSLTDHETRALERHQGVVDALSEIAATLKELHPGSSPE